MCKAVIAVYDEKSLRRIVNIGLSERHDQVTLGQAKLLFARKKAGLIEFTKALGERKFASRDESTVNAVAPGLGCIPDTRL